MVMSNRFLSLNFETRFGGKKPSLFLTLAWSFVQTITDLVKQFSINPSQSLWFEVILAPWSIIL